MGNLICAWKINNMSYLWKENLDIQWQEWEQLLTEYIFVILKFWII